jgi:hypothetical protein
LTSPTPHSRTTFRSLSPAERQKEAERIHKERRDLTRRNDDKRWVPGGEKHRPDHSAGGKVYPAENSHCPPSSAKKISLKVKDLLSDTRETSRKRAQEINRERTVHCLDTLPSGERSVCRLPVLIDLSHSPKNVSPESKEQRNRQNYVSPQ